MANPLGTLAGRVPDWGVKLVYGETRTVDGQELVPVAVTAFGFGAGGGTGPSDGAAAAPEGEGGGGGGWAAPVGAYIAGPDGLRFRANPLALMVVAVPLVTAAGLAIARIIRA